jgi:hypothetical protein
MLNPFIIEQIRKRELERERERARELVLPLDMPYRKRVDDEDNTEGDSDRGVIIIDLYTES